MEFSTDITTILKDGEEQLTFYLNKPNKRGWGVVYLRLRIGSYVLRLSTTVRVKLQYWSFKEGRIILPLYLSDLERKIHEIADEKLKSVKSFVLSNFFIYFCNVESAQPTNIKINAFKKVIVKFLNHNHMSNKNKESLSLLLIKECHKINNEKTQKNVLGIVSNFKRFLQSSGIADSIESVNQKTMRQYLSWLQDPKNGVSVARGKNCINYIFKLLRGIDNANGFDFQIDRRIIEGYKEIRSMEERRKNAIALTEEEIVKLASLKLEGRLAVARDIFLLQCYCGFRFEDLSRLLDSKNLKAVKGISYAVFETQKKDITSQTPLNHTKYYPQAYEIYKRYQDKSPYTDKQHDIYNKAIKEVAELAQLDREIVITSTKGLTKTKETVKVYEKISSHDGRHTFITNCIRYKNIAPSVLKNISGHADIKLIETVYCNLETEDRINAVHNVGGEDKSLIDYKSLGISGEMEAKSVLSFLGVEFDNSLGFEELVRLIKERQYYIADNYGIDIRILKDIYNLTLPISIRVRALKSLLRGILSE